MNTTAPGRTRLHRSRGRAGRHPSVDRRAHSASYLELRGGNAGTENLLDFCVPTNSYFPTASMLEQLREDLPALLRYYPGDAATTSTRLASVLGLNPQTVAMANGSTELITWIDRLLVTESIAVPIPTFGRWTDQPLETGKRVDMYRLQESEQFRLDVEDYVRFVRSRGSRVAVVCQQNNPDGGYLMRERMIAMLDELADLDLVVVDESFIDFVTAEPVCSIADEAAVRPNVVVLKSLGKSFGLHGVRFGYLVANPALTEQISRALPKWNVNSLAQAVVGMIEDHLPEYRRSLALTARDRDAMVDRLRAVPGLTVFPASSNFVLVRLPDGWSGPGLRDHLLNAHGVYIRECGNKLGATSQHVRLVVRRAEEVQRLLAGIEDYAGQAERGSKAG